MEEQMSNVLKVISLEEQIKMICEKSNEGEISDFFNDKGNLIGNLTESWIYQDKEGKSANCALHCQYTGFIVEYNCEQNEAINFGAQKLFEVIKLLFDLKIVYKILCLPIFMELSNTIYDNSSGKLVITKREQERGMFSFYFMPTFEFGVDWSENRNKLNELFKSNNIECEALREGELPNIIIKYEND